MFFKLFNKKKKCNTSEEVPSYKDRILEQRYINKKDKIQEIKTSINDELKHMVENGYIYGCVYMPSFLPLSKKDVRRILKEMEPQDEYRGVSFRISLASHYADYYIDIKINEN